jgi:hypothetical protein
LANRTELINRLKRNTDNQFFLDLVQLLEFRLSVIKDQLVKCTDEPETKRLQGRGQELQELITDLTRKPLVSKQATGAFH